MDADRLRQLLNYDPETGTFTWRMNRGGTARSGAIAGGPIKNGYWLIRVDGRSVYAHRLAWLYVHGEMPPNDIDHIDQDRFNNRLANLRLATRSQNHANRRVVRNGLKGAFQIKRAGRWTSSISVRGRRFYLGCFKTEAEAHAAYKAAAIQHFGEFARTT